MPVLYPMRMRSSRALRLSERWPINAHGMTLMAQSREQRVDEQERRLLAELARTGELKSCAESKATLAVPENLFTFADAVRHFRATWMVAALKPSTRHAYGKLLDAVLSPRLNSRKLIEIQGTDLSLLDAEMAEDGLKRSTRRTFTWCFAQCCGRRRMVASFRNCRSCRVCRKWVRPSCERCAERISTLFSPWLHRPRGSQSRLPRMQAFGLARCEAFDGATSTLRRIRLSFGEPFVAGLNQRRSRTISVSFRLRQHFVPSSRRLHRARRSRLGRRWL